MNDPHMPQSTRRDGNAHHYDYEPTSPHFLDFSEPETVCSDVTCDDTSRTLFGTCTYTRWPRS